jgi:hypothetical protein
MPQGRGSRKFPLSWSALNGSAEALVDNAGNAHVHATFDKLAKIAPKLVRWHRNHQYQRTARGPSFGSTPKHAVALLNRTRVALMSLQRLLHKKGRAMTLAAGSRVTYELVPSTKLVETEAAFILAKVT